MTVGRINLTVYTGVHQVRLGTGSGLSAKVSENRTVRDALDVVYVAFRYADTAALRRKAATLDAHRQDSGLVVYPIQRQRTGTGYMKGRPVPLTTQLSGLGTAEILLVRPHGGGYGR